MVPTVGPFPISAGRHRRRFEALAPEIDRAGLTIGRKKRLAREVADRGSFEFITGGNQ